MLYLGCFAGNLFHAHKIALLFSSSCRQFIMAGLEFGIKVSETISLTPTYFGPRYSMLGLVYCWSNSNCLTKGLSADWSPQGRVQAIFVLSFLNHLVSMTTEWSYMP